MQDLDNLKKNTLWEKNLYDEYWNSECEEIFFDEKKDQVLDENLADALYTLVTKKSIMAKYTDFSDGLVQFNTHVTNFFLYFSWK